MTRPFVFERMSPTEVSSLLGVKVNTLGTWRWTKRYELPYFKIGTKVYYNKSDVEAFIKSGQVIIKRKGKDWTLYKDEDADY